MPQLSNTMTEQWFHSGHGGMNLKLTSIPVTSMLVISVSLRYWHYDDYSGEHIAILDIQAITKKN